ncbi:MAG: histidine ammonia-lyase [Acidobacteria bacterium]|nr:histidine ammonia-lyase [Acidobacteriota bacterium]
MITIDGNSLSLDQLVRVAVGGETLELSSDARTRIETARGVIERALAGDAVIYGVTTGFGKLSEVRIPREKIRELQVNLLRSHASGAGEPLPETEVRGAMLLRANSLAKGFSGVRTAVVETLVQLLNRRVHPIVPSRGSVGASGDLAPSAHMALVMIGEGEAMLHGDPLAGAEALRRAGIAPLDLEAKEGLSLLNGTQFIAAVGGLAVARALVLAETADVAGALSTEVLLGTPAASDSRIQEVRPHPGQGRVAETIRRLLADSEIVASHRDCGRVQDAYSLRCIPQVHGAAHDALEHICEILTREFNSATDNPLVFAQDGLVLSGGNFHGAPLAHALDYAAIVLADLAGISERRIERLVNPDLSGLPAFLAPEPGLTSGYMMLQVTAAALVSECKLLSHPASVDSIPTSGGKEDHVSMGLTAALKLRTIVDHLETVLAGELLAACQAMEYRRPLRPGSGTGQAYDIVRSAVSALSGDRPAAKDIEAVRRLIRSARFSGLGASGRGSASPN